MKNIILSVVLSSFISVSFIGLFSFNSNSQKDTEVFSIEQLESSLPIGSVVSWSGNPAFLPSNWKVCDGSQLPKVSFN
jgi:hypothetical protein